MRHIGGGAPAPNADAFPLRSRGRKQRLLLASLLVHLARSATPDRLAHLLWRENPPADPRRALRTQASHLRSFLRDAGGPEGILECGPGGYRLNAEAFGLDSDLFRSLLQDARGASDRTRELELLGRALELWRGPAFVDFIDDSVLAGPARSLEELRLGAQERRVECLLDVGRTAEARDHTLVRYDERGSGLSDWDANEISLEAWVLDLETIVDTLGLERFPLLGISQGCAICIEYAARHPDRVSGLILHGGYAAGWRVDPTYDAAEVARRDASIEMIRHGWGEDTPAYRQMFTLTFIPGGTPKQIEWFNELERRTVSPENAVRFMEAFARIDVRTRLADVRAPTLVLHSRGDQRIHYRKGMELAEGIPDARFVMLESRNHLILEHEPAFQAWLDETRRFLARRTGSPKPL